MIAIKCNGSKDHHPSPATTSMEWQVETGIYTDRERILRVWLIMRYGSAADGTFHKAVGATLRVLLSA